MNAEIRDHARVDADPSDITHDQSPRPRPRVIPTRLDARRRAWACAGGVGLGVLAARGLIETGVVFNPGTGGPHLSPIVFGAAGLLAAMVLLVPSGLARGLVLGAAVLVGFGSAHARLAEPPPDHLSRLLVGAHPSDAPLLVRVRGMILSSPRRTEVEAGTLDEKLVRFGTPADAFRLRLDSAISADEATPDIQTSRPATGTVRLLVGDLTPGEVRAGDRIEVLGLLSAVGPPMNPGQPDSRLWARQSGDAGSLRASAGTLRIIEPAGVGDRIRALAVRRIAEFRRRAIDTIDGDTPGADAVRAMLLGERVRTGRADAAFVRTGTSHLLAISGFHLSVLAMLTVGLVRTAGDRPKLEAAVGLAFLAAYLLLVPAHTPIVRAALLAAAALVARFFARRWDTLTLLGWATAMLIVFRPMDLTTLGFQLTIGVTALLVWMTTGRHPWTTGRTMRVTLDATLGRPVTRRRMVFESVRAAAVTALLVWLASAPIILYHTGSFNPLAPLAVLVATPFATAIQVLGLAGLAASAVSEPIGHALLGGTLGLGRALAWITGLFDAAGTHRVFPPVSVVWSACALGAVLFLIVRARLRDWRPWAALACVAVWFGVETTAAADLGPGVAARVDMLAIGDGSCLLVRAGGDAVLWDAGSLRPRMGVRAIPSALRELGSPRVRTALVTHANVDHYGALPDAAVAIGLRRVLVSAPALATMRTAGDGSAERLFLSQMAALGIRVEPFARGDTLRLGGATLRVLWPTTEPPRRIRAANDRSLVARLEVPTDAGERRVLLVGDIQRPAMLMLLADDLPDGAPGPGPLDADITELAHHGSHHAVAEAFLEAVDPSVVLQSTGPSRAGDRRWNRVKRELGAWWGITARDGALWSAIGEDGSVSAGSAREGW